MRSCATSSPSHGHHARWLPHPILAFVVGVLLAATGASAAQADPPTRSTEPPFDFETSLFCGFPGRHLRRTARLSGLPW
jgi:hypothetical protein